MTLANVAKEANVAIMTASKVFRGDTSVRPYLKERVLAAAQKLDYQPNLLAQGLRSKSSNIVTLGMLLMENPFFGALTGHLCRQLVDAGLVGAVCHNIGRVGEVNRISHACATIITSGTMDILKELRPNSFISLCAADYDHKLAPEVRINFKSAYETLGRELVAANKTRIVFCCPTGQWESNHDLKFKHLEKTLPHVGAQNVLGPGKYFDNGERLVSAIKDGQAVDAVICQSDTYANFIGGYLNAAIPAWAKSITLVGCDGNLVSPAMWSVHVDNDELASKAVSVLLEHRATPLPPDTYYVEPSIIKTPLCTVENI